MIRVARARHRRRRQRSRLLYLSWIIGVFGTQTLSHFSLSIFDTFACDRFSHSIRLQNKLTEGAMAGSHQNHAMKESASTPFALAKCLDFRNTEHPSQLPSMNHLSFLNISRVIGTLIKCVEECACEKCPSSHNIYFHARRTNSSTPLPLQQRVLATKKRYLVQCSRRALVMIGHYLKSFMHDKRIV